MTLRVDIFYRHIALGTFPYLYWLPLKRYYIFKMPKPTCVSLYKAPHSQHQIVICNRVLKCAFALQNHQKAILATTIQVIQNPLHTLTVD